MKNTARQNSNDERGKQVGDETIATIFDEAYYVTTREKGDDGDG